MSNRREEKKTGCWTNRSQLEAVLIGAILTALLIATILLIFVIKKSSREKSVELSSDVCHTPTCVHEAAKIVERVDSNVNPCEDFYQFACGNFLKTTHGDEKLNRFYQMREQQKLQLLEMYAEDVQDDDHKIVKSTKNLFKTCMNEAEIEKDNLKTIKMALEEIGNWPVLSFKWNETNYDWLRATYKLRELGYPFSIFLNLGVQEDMENNGSYIFKVKTPDFSNCMLAKYSKDHAVQIMTEIAVQFGAQDRQFAFKQMDGTYRFWKYLQSLVLYTDNSRVTINDFQQKFGNTFNWLEFISNITGSTVQISKNEYVIFQNEEALRSILELITTTPKRTLANYMIWRVIEEQLPYLHKNIRNLDTKKQKNEELTTFGSLDQTRAEFCLEETQKRFKPSPIEMMYNRKYLPLKKRKLVEEILLNIKSEFVNLLQNGAWMEKKEKEITMAKAEAITVIVGQPGNYFDDKMLDALDVDMVETKTGTFLDFLAQADRNHQTSLYNQIKMTSEILFNTWYSQEADDYIYDVDNNVLFVSTIVIQGLLFQENGPNYLNYGLLGNAFLSVLQKFEAELSFGENPTEKWSNAISDATVMINQCLKKDLEECGLNNDGFKVLYTKNLGIGEKLSYAAYKKWAKMHREEEKLIGIDYTPQQLFWISATYCITSNVYSRMHSLLFKDQMFFQDVTCGARRSNFDFAKDFDCPTGSRMNPVTKCKLL